MVPSNGVHTAVSRVPSASESELDMGLGRDDAPVLRGEAGDTSCSCALPNFQYFSSNRLCWDILGFYWGLYWGCIRVMIAGLKLAP